MPTVLLIGHDVTMAPLRERLTAELHDWRVSLVTFGRDEPQELLIRRCADAWPAADVAIIEADMQDGSGLRLPGAAIYCSLCAVREKAAILLTWQRDPMPLLATDRPTASRDLCQLLSADAVLWHTLPANVSEIAAAVRRLGGGLGRAAERTDQFREVELAEHLERVSHNARNIRASLRILRGAWQLGLTTREDFCEGLQALAGSIDTAEWNSLEARLQLLPDTGWSLPQFQAPSRKVLLIDDQAVTAGWYWALKPVCAAEGAALLCCSTFAEAQELLKAERPDLILLDLHLPDTSPKALVRDVTRVAPTVPVVAFTADNTGRTTRDIASHVVGVFYKEVDDYAGADVVGYVKRLKSMFQSGFMHAVTSAWWRCDFDAARSAVKGHLPGYDDETAQLVERHLALLNTPGSDADRRERFAASAADNLARTSVARANLDSQTFWRALYGCHESMVMWALSLFADFKREVPIVAESELQNEPLKIAALLKHQRENGYWTGQNWLDAHLPLHWILEHGFDELRNRLIHDTVSLTSADYNDRLKRLGIVDAEEPELLLISLAERSLSHVGNAATVARILLKLASSDTSDEIPSGAVASALRSYRQGRAACIANFRIELEDLKGRFRKRLPELLTALEEPHLLQRYQERLEGFEIPDEELEWPAVEWLHVKSRVLPAPILDRLLIAVAADDGKLARTTKRGNATRRPRLFRRWLLENESPQETFAGYVKNVAALI